MDIFDWEVSKGRAVTVQKEYSDLMKIKKRLVDKLSVGYFYSKLLRSGEIVPGTIDNLKPIGKCTNVGN